MCNLLSKAQEKAFSEDEISVSVIVPAYNCADSLVRCAESVLSQSNGDGLNLELVLVDDGSLDTTWDICQSLAALDSRVTAIHKDNGGVSSARNTGIEVAGGVYLLFADADDELCPNSLKALVEAAKSTDADLLNAGYYRVSSVYIHRKSPHKDSIMNRDEAITSLLLEKEIDPNVWTKLFRRKNCMAVKFDENMSIGEDRDFIFRYLMGAEKIVLRKAFLYRYHITSNSTMRSGFSRKYLESVRFSERVAEEYGLKHPYCRSMLQAQVLRTKCRVIRSMLMEESLPIQDIELLDSIVSQIDELFHFRILFQLPIRHIVMCLHSRYIALFFWRLTHKSGAYD